MAIENIKKTIKVILANGYKFTVKRIINVAITEKIKTP
jgi:hypothetical protein